MQTLTPKWDERVEMPLTRRRALMHVILFDWDRVGTDDFLGEVLVSLDRQASRLVVTIVDHGVGISPEWTLQEDANLGLQIASTLVESELSGELSVDRRDDAGTRAEIRLPLQG